MQICISNRINCLPSSNWNWRHSICSPYTEITHAKELT